jgi:hypothetical protein
MRAVTDVRQARDSPRHGPCQAPSRMSVKSIVLSLALAYAVWALFINGRGAYELFVGRPYADRQHAERYRNKLAGSKLETAVRNANLFGKTAHAKFVECDDGRYSRDRPWDYVCLIDNYVVANNAPIDPGRVFKGTKIGLMVDDTHITRTSALVPADGPDPPFK